MADMPGISCFDAGYRSCILFRDAGCDNDWVYTELVSGSQISQDTGATAWVETPNQHNSWTRRTASAHG